MTLGRRIATVERALSPTELVLRWLDEAHAHGSLEAYVAATLDAEEMPLDRLCREARRSTLNEPSSKRPDVRSQAVRAALQGTVLRFELVVRINVVAYEMLDREGLMYAMLTSQLALVAGEETRSDDEGVALLRRLATLRGVAADRLAALEDAALARADVEQRYLGGRPALFPDVAGSWDERLEESSGLADLADRLLQAYGVDPAHEMDQTAGERDIGQLVADLVEPAKAVALDKLGDGEGAARVATSWTRSKLAAHTAVSMDPVES